MMGTPAVDMVPRVSSDDLRAEVVRKTFNNERYFLETFVSIKTQSLGIQPFIFRPVQADFYKKRTYRDIVLKSRRHGMSTLIMGIGLARVLTREGYRVLIVCHEPEAATTMFEDLKVMFNSLPKWLQPKVGLDNQRELTFPDLGSSRISITTAGKDIASAQGLGRSGNVNFLHCSEFAFWPLPKMSMTAVMQCVPLDGEVVIESTALGYNQFQQLWAQSVRGEGNYKIHFYGWNKDPNCQIPLFPREEEVLRSEDHPKRLTDTEKSLIQKYDLPLERIKWRRWKINDMADPEKFPQEFPINADECFLQSGRPRFNQTVIKAMLDSTRLPALPTWPDGNPVPHGFRLFIPPRPGLSCCAGADCAEGLLKGDNDSITLLDRETGEEVLHVWGKLGTDLVTKYIILIHYMYKSEVFWGIERNAHGQTVLSNLLTHEGFPSRYIYHYADWDDAFQRLSQRPGWYTSTKSRPILIDEYASAVNRRHVRLHDADKLREHLTFVVGDSGKAEAQQGANDDSVLSTAIAWQMRKHEPFTQRGW